MHPDAPARAQRELLAALELEPLGGDRFRAGHERGRFGRIFGGQLLAQTLQAASATVPDQDPASLHACFAKAGNVEDPIELAVRRVRDGRSISTRQVEVTQGDQPLLTAIASFHTNSTEPELRVPPPSVAGPDETPTLQDWVSGVAPERAPQARTWIDRPPAVEMRIAEPPYFLGGTHASGTRSHWMRLPSDPGDDPVRQAALLAYASDYLLLDMGFRSHPEQVPIADLMGLSLDHAVWFHRPVRFERWHLHTQELLALSGERGLVRGAIHDEAGHLVASAMQEILVRIAR